MGFLSKLSSFGKKLGKSVATSVGGAVAQRAGNALGKGVNSAANNFLSRVSGQVPPIGNFPGKALAPLSSAAIKLTPPKLGGISNVVKLGSQKYGKNPF